MSATVLDPDHDRHEHDYKDDDDCYDYEDDYDDSVGFAGGPLWDSV